MTSGQIFTSRLKGRPLLDSEGMAIGRIRDVVILPAGGSEPPRALGLVVTLQRRRIFVNLGRIAEGSIDGAHLRGGTVDLDRFTQRTGDILASDLYGRATKTGTVADVAIVPCEQQRVGWEVCAIAVAHGRGLRHRATTIEPWDQAAELFQGALADGVTTQDLEGSLTRLAKLIADQPLPPGSDPFEPSGEQLRHPRPD